MLPFLLLAHLLSVVVWVGGMFFAWVVLRPAAAEMLEGPHRLRLWNKVFAGFFPWVWVAVLLLLLSGYTMIFNVYGGMAGSGLYIHIMQGIGLLMMLIFAHLFFAPYARFKRFVAAEDWQSAAAQLVTIRKTVGFNLILGLLTIVVAMVGRSYLP